jgi:hypothetical protein
MSRKAAPVTITFVNTKRNAVNLSQPFDEEDDWFEGLTVGLTNVSDKTITYIGVGFLFPRPTTQEKNPPFYHTIRHGLNPQAPEEAILSNQPIAILPGEIINVTLPESVF